MRVNEIMEQLDELLSKAVVIPFKQSVIVNPRELRALLDELADTLPVELEEAQNLLRRKEEILNGAKAEAQRIIQNAEENRRALVSNSEIIRAAESRAKTMLFNANNQAAEINRASMEYIENQLKQVEDTLAKSLQNVHTTKQAFSAKRQK